MLATSRHRAARCALVAALMFASLFLARHAAGLEPSANDPPPPEASPGARYGHELVFDEARGTTLLFGGFETNGEPLGDTWSWDGQRWDRLATEGPSPRKWPAAAYDARRQVIVLFGGREGVGRSGASMADTWIWDGKRWQQSQAQGPAGRDHHRMVYDRKRDRMVLFGGWDGQQVIGDTWEWDGAQWHRIETSEPAPRAPFGMVYDEARSRVALMGGKDLEQSFDDVWTWDGRTWTRHDDSGPGPRSFHAMTYDRSHQRTLVVAGRVGNTLLHDLWSWDGAQWQQLSSAVPMRRGIHAAAWDPLRRNLVLHGSGNRVDGGWALEASTWTWSDSTAWVHETLRDIVTLRLQGRLEEARSRAEQRLGSADIGPRTRVALHLELAKIFDRVGLHTNTRPVIAGLEHIGAADSLAQNLDAATRGAVAAAYGDYHYRAESRDSGFPESRQHLQRAINLLREGQDLRALSDVVHRLGLVHLQERDLVRAQELFDESLQLDTAGTTRTWFLGEYHRHTAFVFVFDENWQAALPHFERSLEARRVAGAIDASLFAGVSVGTAHLRTGDPQAAVPYLEEALRIADRIDSNAGRARAAIVLGEAYKETGKPEEARKTYERAREAAHTVHYLGISTRAAAALAELARP